MGTTKDEEVQFEESCLHKVWRVQKARMCVKRVWAGGWDKNSVTQVRTQIGTVSAEVYRSKGGNSSRKKVLRYSIQCNITEKKQRMWTRCLTWANRAIQGWHRAIPNWCTGRRGSIGLCSNHRCTINFLFHCFRTGSSLAATTTAYRRGPDWQTSTSRTATYVTGWAAPNGTQRNRRVSNGLQRFISLWINNIRHTTNQGRDSFECGEIFLHEGWI